MISRRINTIILLISIALLTYVGFYGIKIGSFEILSISQLIEKNDRLNEKIQQASNLTTKSYHENIDTLEETYEEYKIQKQKYEELAGVTKCYNEEIYETKKYDIGYLWRVLGKYAEKRRLNLGIDVQKNATTKNSYNINFSVSGKYVNISQFITDIENDSDLYFRIYNFKMTGNSELVAASFTVRNINIDPSTITQKTGFDFEK